MGYTLDTKRQIGVKYAAWDVKVIHSSLAYGAADRHWGIGYALPAYAATCLKRKSPREQMLTGAPLAAWSEEISA
jgi:hypothetical protein